MKETYREMKERHAVEMEKLPYFAAFDTAQFAAGMKNLGVASTTELASLGYGCYTRKEDKHLWQEHFTRTDKERKEAMQDKDFCIGMFEYELANHEYCITYEDGDALGACGLCAKDLTDNDDLRGWYAIAKKRYLAEAH